MSITQIIQDMEDELQENACFHELDSFTDDMIIFNYPHYWDGYSEFRDDIALETENLLGLAQELKLAGFKGYLYVNDYVRKIG